VCALVGQINYLTDSCRQIFWIYCHSIPVIMLCYTSQATKQLCT